MNLVVEYKPKPLTVKHAHFKSMLALEGVIRQLAEQPGHEFDRDEKHWHCEGVYVREFNMPADSVVTGQVHRKACINILLKGKIKVVQSDGSRVIEAPAIYVSEPGEKKALYALEDTTFLTCHATEETDQDKLWAEFTVPEHELIEEMTE